MATDASDSRCTQSGKGPSCDRYVSDNLGDPSQVQEENHKESLQEQNRFPDQQCNENLRRYRVYHRVPNHS